jgi:hypothetical protein
VAATDQGYPSIAAPLLCGGWPILEPVQADCCLSATAAAWSWTPVNAPCQPAKPHLPIERVTRFEFVLNVKTAKTLGMDVPPTVLARANEVVE